MKRKKRIGLLTLLSLFVASVLTATSFGYWNLSNEINQTVSNVENGIQVNANQYSNDVAVMKIPYSSKKKEPEHLHYDINFLFIVDNYDYETSNESMEIKWVTIDEALNLVDKNDFSMQRMIKKYKRFIGYGN